MVKVGSGDIWVNAANVSFIEDDVVVMSNKHRYKASEEALGVIKAEMAASELRKAEILEVVCKLYADGFTGNKIIKAIGNAVTYNTDAVTEGDIYCVSYRDGGFYVGLRTTEDYEPKEGDWWCYSSSKTNYEAYSEYIPFPLMKLSYCLGYLKYYDSIVTNWITQPNLQSTKGVWSKLMNNTTPSVYQVVSSRNGLFIDYSEVSNPSYTDDSIVRVNNSFGPKDVIDVNRKPRYTFLFKPISIADLLVYKATSQMGLLMFGEELEVSDNTSYNANKQFRIKNNVKYAVVYYDADNNQVEVDFATQNRHGAKCTMYNNNDNIYNIYATEKIGTGSNAIYIYQLDFESHYQDGVMERQITSEKRVEGETGAYHHIKVFPVLQDNRPVTT